MQNNKQLLRTWLKAKRLRLPKDEAYAKSQDISRKLQASFNWTAIKSVHCYQPIESLNEVDTSGIIKFLNSDLPNIDLGIQEQIGEEVSNKSYDLIIVPTLGFDSRGYRLGWGGGFYDRFLAKQPKAIKLGLCFDDYLVKPGIPNEEHDIPLNFVVTEKQLYKF